MARIINTAHHMSLDDYAAVSRLASAIQELRTEAGLLVPRLANRTIWVVNSTEKGGGVAEMLPTQVSLLRELGLDVRWVVMETDDQDFFSLTKRIHNLIHGKGDPELGPRHREVYEAVNRDNAAALRPRLRPDDLLIIHDPQPLGMGAILKEELGIRAIWRCHIGLDEQTPETRAAWEFLRPYAAWYDHAVFSVPEYIPDYLAGRATIIHPALDPLSHKNRELPIHKLVGILCNAALAPQYAPVLVPSFPQGAQRLQADGSWAPAVVPDDIGLLFRPVITQVSRWDRLKGFAPLLQGFQALKTRLEDGGIPEGRHRRRIEIVRLELAGPDPASIQDDPEGREVLEGLRRIYADMLPAVQRDVALLALPMASLKENALMVNALQRCSSIVAQNSLREGFGLTATEAMWKGVAVMGSSAAGLRQQIRDGLDGRLVHDPQDVDEIARVLDEMLDDSQGRDAWGRSAERRVTKEFLIFSQLRRWMETLVETVAG